MEFLVIAYSFLAFILVVIIASPWGARSDKKQSRIDKINNSVGQPVFQELQLSFYDRFLGKSIIVLQFPMRMFLCICGKFVYISLLIF